MAVSDIKAMRSFIDGPLRGGVYDVIIDLYGNLEKWSFVAAAQVAVLIKARPDIDPNLA